MTESAKLDDIAAKVLTAVEGCGAMILETIPDDKNLATVVLNADKFPALIEHLKPRLVYLFVEKFDGREDVASQLNLDEDSLDRDQKKLADKWSKHNGKTSALAIGVMCDGILHAVIDKPEWYEEFEEEAETFQAARHEAINQAFALEQATERARREAQEKKRLAPIVEKLVADPRFDAPKISAAKRLALAETMYPNEDKSTLKAVVAFATNELWLKGQ